tara:strand:- start:73 stop:324 length:252 start_codon:yes stop_codon:yes gene_type:complete
MQSDPRYVLLPPALVYVAPSISLPTIVMGKKWLQVCVVRKLGDRTIAQLTGDGFDVIYVNVSTMHFLCVLLVPLAHLSENVRV